MKIIIKIVLIIVIITIATGYYLKYTDYPDAEAIIGIGILILAFVLMPLFIIHRYRGKDLSKYVDGINLNEMEQSQYKDKEQD